jgi:hypothetical protein
MMLMRRWWVAAAGLTVTDAITGNASGGANVVVQGDPPLQNIDVSGGADLSNG